MKPTVSLDQIARKTNTRQKKRKYIIVTEGQVTEYNYFVSLANCSADVGISSLVDVVVMRRYALQDGYSNPIRLVQLTEDYLRMIEGGEYSAELFIGKILDSAAECHPSAKNDFTRISKELAELLETNGLLKDGMISNEDQAEELILQYLKKEHSLSNFEIIDDSLDYDPEIDRICIVTDRDKTNSRDIGQYKEFLKRCESDGFKQYVTNPKFELWVLLHYDIDGFLSELKDRKRCLSEIDRRMKDLGLLRKDIDFSMVVYRIDNAMENAKVFCSDIKLLEKEPGTNIPELIEFMRVNK